MVVAPTKAQTAQTKSSDNEVWSKSNSCVACQVTCTSEEEKNVHEKLPLHIKKFNIYSFFSKEAANLASSSKPSALLKRYQIMNERAVGLECIHEFRFPWCLSGWWACSICYESGCHYEQADRHIRSATHLATYMEEFHPSKAEQLSNRDDSTKFYEQLLKLRDQLFTVDQGGKLLPPEVLSISLTKEQAMTKLVATEPPISRIVHVHPLATDTVKRISLQCEICHEVVHCHKKTASRAWSVHEGSLHHKNAVAIKNMMDEFGIVEVVDNEISPDVMAFAWKTKRRRFFGPVCGINQLVNFGRENYCKLCFCKVASIEDHFSSEGHILKFLTLKQCMDACKISQQSGPTRREALIKYLMDISLDNDRTWKIPLEAIPRSILEYSMVEKLSSPPCMPPLLQLGFEDKCLECRDCCLSVKVEKSVAKRDQGIALWNEHVTSAGHFDYMARRSTFNFEDRFFVPVVSSVQLAKSELCGAWKDLAVDESTSYRIQTQCDIGLEYMVEDIENDEVVCTLCARSYKRDAHDHINNHIRSYMHVIQYINMENKELLSMVLRAKSETTVQDLLLEWLQRHAKFAQPNGYQPAYLESFAYHKNWSQIKVYSIDKALALRNFTSVPTRTVSLVYCDPSIRPIIAALAPVIDEVARDDVEKQSVDLREALCSSPCRILQMQHALDPKTTSRVLFRCMTCHIAFTAQMGTVVNTVFEEHLQSTSHETRLASLDTCKLDMSGYSDETSSYTVKPFMQRNPARKVTWQWNPLNKNHDFVLSVVGLTDVVERRSVHDDKYYNPDFYCKLCAVAITKRGVPLESHVRSAAHVICYVHKYHPLKVITLDSLPKDDGGKQQRRYLSQLLKDVRPPSEYCIPVYDPVGEDKKRRVAVMQKALETEKQRINEEMRNKAREQRLQRDEERRKLREKELKREQQRKEEREKRENEAKERASKLEEERARLRQVALEAAKKQEEAKLVAAQKAAKLKENQEAEDAARREKERANLQQILNREKARLKMMQDRDKAMKLVQEKVNLEKKMKLLQQKAEIQKNAQPFVVVPEPQLIIPTKLMEDRSSQQTKADFMTSNQFPNSVASSYNHPPPVPFGVPPPMIRETLEKVGPKPTFSSFVPQADVMPVYPTKDADDMDSDRSRTSTPEKKHSKRRRSRSAERKSRKKEKKRKRSRSRDSTDQKSVPDVLNMPSRPDGYRASLQGREVDPYVSNPAIITTRSALVDFIWRQGAERIPNSELPEEFSKKAVEIEGNVGVDSLYEVVCIDSPDLDTFYCSMCGVWTTPSDMFRHLGTPEHKLSYLFRNYKMYHQTIMSETNSIVKESMLTQFAIQIWKMEQPPAKVTNRLRAVLDRATIFRCWPEHIHILDHSWKKAPIGRVDVPAPVSKEAMGAYMAASNERDVREKDSESESPSVKADVIDVTKEDTPKPVKNDKKKRSESPKRRKRSNSRDSRTTKRRKRSTTPDKKRRSRSREKSRRDRRSRSRTRRSRSRDRRSRSRKRSRSRDRRHRSRSRDRKDHVSRSKKDDLSWMETAAAFLEKLGDHSAAEKVRAEQGKKHEEAAPRRSRSRSPSRRKSESSSHHATSDVNNFNTRLAQIRNLANPVSAKPAAPECIVLEDDPKPAADQPVDPKVEMRKLLGVLITMQQEAEKTGGVDSSVVERLFREVGLQTRKDVSNDQLLAQLCCQLAGEPQVSTHKTIDLGAFGIQSGPVTSQPPPLVAKQPNPASSMDQYKNQSGQDKNTQLEKILSGISGSLSTLKKNRPQSPIIKPNRAFIPRAEDVFTDDAVSFVYPDLGSDGKEAEAATQGQPSVNQQQSNPSGGSVSAYTTVPSQQRQMPTQDEGSSSRDPQSTVDPYSKKDVPSRKQVLLEQAEKLRKQAEAANDEEDEWDSLESEISQILAKPIPEKKAAEGRPNTNKIGVPTKWAQPVPQPKKNEVEQVNNVQPLPSPAASTANMVPIAPGQKMALARTMLPNGKLPPGYVQQPMQPEVSRAPPGRDDDIQVIPSSGMTAASQATSVPANSWAGASFNVAGAPGTTGVYYSQPGAYPVQQQSQPTYAYGQQPQQFYQQPPPPTYPAAYVNPVQQPYVAPPGYPSQPPVPQQYYSSQQPQYYNGQQYGGGY